MSKKVYEIVTERILAELDKGVVPWRKPWKECGLPRNLISKKEYRGINAMILACGASSPWFASFKQITGLGGRVKKGAKGFPVVFWTFLQKEDNEGNEKTIPFMRYYTVFSIEDTEGLEKHIPKVGEREFSAIEEAERIIANMPNRPTMKIVEGNRAFYRPSEDSVTLPKPEQFDSNESYYTVAFHELAHSTGHSSRLNRGLDDSLSPFGSPDYSREELIAEITASFLSAHCGIDSMTLENSASYIASWQKALRDDSMAFAVAAGRAQKAADYILNVKFSHEEKGGSYEDLE